MSVREIIRRATRHRVIRKKLPPQFGGTPFYASPDAALRYLRPGLAAFDSFLLRVAEEELNEQSVVWDVGGNVGLFTFAAASIANRGTVVTIEADIWLASILRRSANLPENRHRDIRVLPVAVSDSVGVAKFCIAKNGRASNFIDGLGGRKISGGVREEVLVPTTTLDNLLDSFPEPQFVKMDIEGAEVAALTGATRLVGEVRPVFCIEVVSEDLADVVMQITREHDYRLFDAGTSRKSAPPIDQCVANTLVVPAEKAG